MCLVVVRIHAFCTVCCLLSHNTSSAGLQAAIKHFIVSSKELPSGTEHFVLC